MIAVHMGNGSNVDILGELSMVTQKSKHIIKNKKGGAPKYQQMSKRIDRFFPPTCCPYKEDERQPKEPVRGERGRGYRREWAVSAQCREGRETKQYNLSSLLETKATQWKGTLSLVLP